MTSTSPVKNSPEIQEYLEAIGKYDLLTAEEEQYYLQQYQNGNQHARDILIVHNLRLVAGIAKHYVTSDMEYLDAIQYGTEGLIKAIEKFEPSKDTRLSTYATYWIRQAINRGYDNCEQKIRVPTHIRSTLFKAKKEKEKFSIQHGTYPTHQELSEILQISPQTLKKYQNYGFSVLSLDQPVSNQKDGEDLTLMNLVSERQGLSPSVEKLGEQQQLHDTLIRLLEEVLTPKEESVLCMRFGIAPVSRPMTLSEVGKELHLSSERIRQIEVRAIEKCRNLLPDHYQDFLN